MTTTPKQFARDQHGRPAIEFSAPHGCVTLHGESAGEVLVSARPYDGESPLILHRVQYTMSATVALDGEKGWTAQRRHTSATDISIHRTHGHDRTAVSRAAWTCAREIIDAVCAWLQSSDHAPAFLRAAELARLQRAVAGCHDAERKAWSVYYAAIDARGTAEQALATFVDDEPASDDEDEGCPKGDPDCESPDDGCHDACEEPDDQPATCGGCGARLEVGPDGEPLTPDTDNDLGWHEVAHLHDADCDWIATRNYTREAR